jgi:two-component system sensor histidine kinase/response regulator
MKKKASYEELAQRVKELEKISAENKLANNAQAHGEESSNLIVSKFLANMSHEIRMPINTIIELTELALDTDVTGQQRGYLETIRQSVNSLPELLNDILDLSKIESHQLQLEEIDFDLRNTVRNAAEILKSKGEDAGLTLLCHIEPDVPTGLVGDPGRLRQVLVNFGENAIKFTEEGEIAIRLEKKYEDDSNVLLHFTISNGGPGVGCDETDGVFNKSSQEDGSTIRDYGRTGWRSSVSRHLVKLMKGRVWVESKSDTMSDVHFTVRFGLSDAKAADGLMLKELDLSGVPILVVDDNEINRLVFQEMASSFGLVPSEAADGKEALAKIEKAFESGEPYQLILMDLDMPGMDGFEVAKIVKQGPYGEDIKIILLTSVGQKGDAAHCKEVGISGYLLKPLVRESELLDTISLALDNAPGEKIPLITRYTIQEAGRRLNFQRAAAA